MERFQVFPTDTLDGRPARDWIIAAVFFVSQLSQESANALEKELSRVLRGKQPEPPLCSRLGLFWLAAVNPHRRIRSTEEALSVIPLISHLLTDAEKRKLGIQRLNVPGFTREQLKRGGPEVEEAMKKAAIKHLTELN